MKSVTSKRMENLGETASRPELVASDLKVQADTPLSAFKTKVKSYHALFTLISATKALKDGLVGLIKGKRGAADHLRSTLSFLKGSNIVKGRPMNITIEPTSACNLACPICETGDRRLNRPTQHMSMSNFKTIMDKIGPHTNTLMFYFMGEPFVNRESYEMIKYAKQLKIPFITTCTNGDFVDAQKIVDSGIDEVQFQIGGITQKTHETYRVNSDLARVLKNLEETIKERNAKGSKMHVNVGLILMKHNEHEISEFMRRMKELGVDKAVIRDPVVRTYDEGVKYLPLDQSHWNYDPQSFKEGRLRPRFLPPNECPWIYYSLTIAANGDVVPCCWDPTAKHVMGNLVTTSLDEVWNGPKFRAFRDQLHEDQGQLDICRQCSSYPHSPVK